MSVNTTAVAGRRELKFNSLQEILAELDQIEARPQQVLGNWSIGTICDHVAKAMIMSLDGPPMQVPWFVRLVGPFLKNRMLSRPMQPGFKLPTRAGERLIDGSVATEAGIASLRQAIQRTMQEPQRARNGVFGHLTRDESDRLMMNHAALHLSFIVPA